jgi:signal transduction histidine kinase
VTARLDAVVAAGRLRRPARAAVLVAGAGAVLAVAVADWVTGLDLSLSVFYLLPVTAVTVAVSPRAGFAFAALAALAWTLAESVIVDAHSGVLQAWNGLLRLAILAVVVALLAALRRTLGDAQASERRSKEFLAYAAHQLRTPVAGVQASAEALVMTTSTAQRDRLVSNLVVESNRIGRLVHSLLSLTRLDQGGSIERRPCDVGGLARAELDRQRALAPHLEATLHVGPGVPGRVLVDPDAVTELLANLLDNARRHATGRIDVSLDAQPTMLRIAVGDDGPGLPAGAEERAFDRFVSLDGRGGSGLGLAIARSLAAAHGGELVYSARRFLVTLPVPQPEG